MKLRQYGYALGISSAKEVNTTAPAIFAIAASHNSVVNMSAYQNAQTLASQAQEIVAQTKTLLPLNMERPQHQQSSRLLTTSLS